jgi:uncharacterized protein (TIGR02145 family)
MKMKKIYPFIAFLLASFAAIGQNGIIGAVFTSADGTHYLPFDSLKVMNLTRACDTVLRYPDSTIVFGYTGVPEKDPRSAKLYLWQNYPNPTEGRSEVKVAISGAGRIELRLTDQKGAVAERSSFDLSAGIHTFLLTGSGSSWYVLTAFQNGFSSSVKIVNTGTGSARPFEIDYIGMENSPVSLKSSTAGAFTFKPGDSLLYIGYSDTLQAGLYARPAGQDTVTFQFSFGMPCPGMPVVEYEGVTYHTVRVFNQCWMKENLNAGVMIAGTAYPSDNGIIEKYCYGDVEDSCATLGAFYQWNEMMAYATSPGSRGICPPGWRIPTDDDWKILEGVSDSLYKVGSSAWDSSGVRGVTAGFILKSPTHWENEGNGSDIYGFTVPPSGYRDSWGYIFGYGHAASYWCADQLDAVNAWSRGFGCHGREVSRFDMEKASGYSVRCLRD